MNIRKSRLILQIPLKTFFWALLYLIYLININAQTNQSQDTPLDNRIMNITACEEWISRVDTALNKWSNNNSAFFIVIARLGDGEYSRRLNQKRIKTLKEYISHFETKVKMVFAEGERVKGDGGLIEIYVEGRLIDSLGIRPKSDIPLRGCNP